MIGATRDKFSRYCNFFGMKRFANAIAICTNPASQRNTRIDVMSASLCALHSPGYFISRATCRGTFAIRRNPPISLAQDFHHPGNLRNPQKRPSPPDFARQRHRRISAAVLAPIAKQELHFEHQFFPWHSQQRTNPRILEWRQRHPASLQNRGDPPCGSRTELALRVKEQPPSRVPPLPVRVLTHQRNHCRPSSLFSFLFSLFSF